MRAPIPHRKENEALYKNASLATRDTRTLSVLSAYHAFKGDSERIREQAERVRDNIARVLDTTEPSLKENASGIQLLSAFSR